MPRPEALLHFPTWSSVALSLLRSSASLASGFESPASGAHSSPPRRKRDHEPDDYSTGVARRDPCHARGQGYSGSVLGRDQSSDSWSNCELDIRFPPPPPPPLRSARLALRRGESAGAAAAAEAVASCCRGVQADYAGVEGVDELVRRVEASARAVSLENDDIVKVPHHVLIALLHCFSFSSSSPARRRAPTRPLQAASKSALPTFCKTHCGWVPLLLAAGRQTSTIAEYVYIRPTLPRALREPTATIRWLIEGGCGRTSFEGTVSGFYDNAVFCAVLLSAQNLRGEEDKTVRLREALWQEGAAKREWEMTTEVFTRSWYFDTPGSTELGTCCKNVFRDARVYGIVFGSGLACQHVGLVRAPFAVDTQHSTPAPALRFRLDRRSLLAPRTYPTLERTVFFRCTRLFNVVSCRLRQASRVLKQRLESTERIRIRQQVKNETIHLSPLRSCLLFAV